PGPGGDPPRGAGRGRRGPADPGPHEPALQRGEVLAPRRAGGRIGGDVRRVLAGGGDRPRTRDPRELPGPGLPEVRPGRFLDHPAPGGTRPGFSICKPIVERMGGRIGFETSSGRGTPFYFDLPTEGAPG